MNGGRYAVSRTSVIDNHFDLQGKTLFENNIMDRPESIPNSDETGFWDNFDRLYKKALYKKGTKFPYQSLIRTREHVTFNYCASASGQVIPPMLIFQKTVTAEAEEPVGAL